MIPEPLPPPAYALQIWHPRGLISWMLASPTGRPMYYWLDTQRRPQPITTPEQLLAHRLFLTVATVAHTNIYLSPKPPRPDWHEGKLARACLVEVSTVFLWLDHSPFISVEPVLFETMVFLDGSNHDELTARYTAWEEARLGHNMVVGLILGELQLLKDLGQEDDDGHA